MLKKIVSIVFVLFIVTGCEQFQSGPSAVILDLDAIANATGQAANINQQMEKVNSELTAQLKTISTKLNEQLEAEKQKIGKKPKTKDKKKLQQLSMQANKKMQQAEALASRESQQYKAALIQELRKNIQPIAEEIARKRGADLVTVSSSSVIWFNPEIDITDEIIAEIRAQPLSRVKAKEDVTTQTEKE